MRKANPTDEDMREEYDFSSGIRGRYAERFSEGSNVVVLDPDVAEKFQTSEAVNEALRRDIERLGSQGNRTVAANSPDTELTTGEIEVLH